MKINLLVIFLVTVVGALSAIYWKVDQDFYAEKLRSNESQSRSQISAIGHSVETELEGLTQILDMAFPILSESTSDYSQEQVFSKFQMIARIAAGPDGEPNFDRKFFLDKSGVKAWGAEYAYLALKSLKNLDLKGGLILSLLDPQRKTWFLFLAQSKISQNQYAAIIAPDFLQSLIDRQKGQISTIGIVNNQGQIIGHNVAEYVGGLLKDDSMVKEFSKSGNVSGSGFFIGDDGEKVHGFYELVGATNLYVTISAPLATLMRDRDHLKQNFIFMGMGIIFVGLAFILLIDQPDKRITMTKLSEGATAAQENKSFKSQANDNSKLRAPAKPVVPMMPPAPPPQSDRTKANDKFDELFSDRKIEKAFDMIDHLESPHSLGDETASEQSAGTASDSGAVEQSSVVQRISPLPESAHEAVGTEPMILNLEKNSADFEEPGHGTRFDSDLLQAVQLKNSEDAMPSIEKHPIIRIDKRESRSDQFSVVVRRPGDPP